MAGPTNFPSAESEATALRRELAVATRAKEENEAKLARLQREANEQQAALLSQVERWKQESAEYRSDAEKMRQWRRVRQKIAPEGSLRHLMVGAIKSAADRALGRRKKDTRVNLENAEILLRCERPDLDAGEKIWGFTCVRGWAWPRGTVSKIEVFVDDVHVGNAFHGFVRPDLLQLHPERGDDVHLGFGFRLDASKLPVGRHILKIRAVREDGQSTSVEGSIEVDDRQDQTPYFDEARADSETTGSHCYNTDGRSYRALTAQEGIDASVVIFARNQAECLDRSLPMIAGQKTSFRYEIIGFDTESDDGTSQIFRRFGARVVAVGRSEFHHVRTRLQSLKEARGKFVVFVVGDALPADNHWLEGLVRPLMDDPQVAASYSRQLPAPDCVPWEARDIYMGCSVVREVRQVDWSEPSEVENYRRHEWKFISFSDVSACYRRAVLEKLPILESLPEVEDQYWCKCLLEAGYRVVLEPTSLVIHSHNLSLRELYRRHVRFGRCFATFMDAEPEPIPRFISRTVTDATNDLLFTVTYPSNLLLKSKWILQAPVMRFVKRYAVREGFRLGGFGREQMNGHEMSGAKASANTVPVERSK